MKWSLVIILFFGLQFCVVGQNFNFKVGQRYEIIEDNTKFVSLDDENYIYISERPVTNREYLTYILWKINVFNTDYPAVVFRSIPLFEYSEHLEESSYSIINDALKYGHPLLKNYIFNPNYLDYPVVGINFQQAMDYCKWLTDRHNEYKLISNGVFLPSFIQMNEQNFSTESYIYGNYSHGMNRDTIIGWDKKYLMPSYRLASNYELSGSPKFDFELSMLDEPVLPFIKPWERNFIEVTENSMILSAFPWSNYDDYGLDTINKLDSTFDFSKYNFIELTLDYGKSGITKNPYKIFKRYGQYKIDSLELASMIQMDKDSLGAMPFIYMEKSVYNEPIYINPVLHNPSIPKNDKTFFYFRYAVRKL